MNSGKDGTVEKLSLSFITLSAYTFRSERTELILASAVIKIVMLPLC